MVELHFEQSLNCPDAVLPPSNPNLDGVAIIQDPSAGADHWVAAGTLTATASISSIALTVYYRDSAGLILDDGTAGQSGTLNAGETWAFKTSAYVGAQPSSCLFALDYKLGGT